MRPTLVSYLLSDDAQNAHKEILRLGAKPAMLEFADAVSRSLRGVDIHFVNRTSAEVYRKGEVHTLGMIGHDTVQRRRDGGQEYYVKSRTIENKKFQSGSPWYNTSSSINMATAVKAASTHLRQYSGEESAAVTRENASRVVNKSIDVLRGLMLTTFRDFTGMPTHAHNSNGPSSRFMGEVRAMAFIDPELQHLSTTYYTHVDNYLAAQAAANTSTYYVGLTDNFGQTLADVVQVADMLSYSGNTIPLITRTPVEAIPEWIQGKLSVLSMLSPDRYVPGVGLRVDDRVFYVIGELIE